MFLKTILFNAKKIIVARYSKIIADHEVIKNKDVKILTLVCMECKKINDLVVRGGKYNINTIDNFIQNSIENCNCKINGMTKGELNKRYADGKNRIDGKVI